MKPYIVVHENGSVTSATDKLIAWYDFGKQMLHIDTHYSAYFCKFNPMTWKDDIAARVAKLYYNK